MQKILSSLVICLLFATTCFAAVSGEVLINGQDPTASGTIITPVRTYDAGKLTADTQTKGLLAVGPLMYNGTNWDRLRGDATNGLKVQGTVSGNTTPSDAFANPTNASVSFSLQGVFIGPSDGWTRLYSSFIGSDAVAVTTNHPAATRSFVALYNGTTYDRQRSGVIIGQVLVDNSSNGFSNIATNTSTVVKASAGIVNKVHVNVVGTTSNVRLYNDTTAPCDTNFVVQIDTTSLVSSGLLNHSFTTGICALTAGAAAADISVLYR